MIHLPVSTVLHLFHLDCDFPFAFFCFSPNFVPLSLPNRSASSTPKQAALQMSSPLNFSSWRGRSSPHSQNDSQDHDQDDTHNDVRKVSSTSSRPIPHPHATALSSSVTSSTRDPVRSFIHGSVKDHLAPLDSLLQAQSVRDDSADLATYLLSDQHDRQSRLAVLSRQRAPPLSNLSFHTSSGGPATPEVHGSQGIEESLQPISSSSSPLSESQPYDGPSMLTSMIRRSPPHSEATSVEEEDEITADLVPMISNEASRGKTHGQIAKNKKKRREDKPLIEEETPLLEQQRTSYGGAGNEGELDIEGQKPSRSNSDLWSAVSHSIANSGKQLFSTVRTVVYPKSWDRQAIWRNLVVEPIVCLPSVIVGLLLNVLDALSYGMILFPLGDPIFAHLGSVGISIFYVSTIISQLTFSSGSIFKGAIGSELIEVVPFFHSMARTITDLVGRDHGDAVIATTITSYALSSMLTGLVFFLMGQFKLGSLVGFIPRHILIGCIGGVGWFLIATGFEVSGRLGSFHYDLETAYKLIQPETVPLWMIPLALAIALFYFHSRVNSKYFLPLYILAIPLIFYIAVFVSGNFHSKFLRDHGWLFQSAPVGEPWWHFYTLYKFRLISWDAIVECIPAMFALTFFGILHVPINVPALALQTGEDHADLDHELKLHGFSNFFSGVAGSIQNYLVYANTIMFMRSGGGSRLAGLELAALTFLVMVIGPYVVGFIPVMMVGTLIFELGFELLLEAVWQPKKKLKPSEYLTVVAIVLVMGIYDFVVGIGVGILLAFATLVFQTSRISAIRNTFSGDVLGSTVRRNPTQHHYLREVGQQVYIVKLSGFLFFGTIVGVEQKIRDLISDDMYKQRPIKFLILDLWNVSGMDYSAGEAFNTISRLLKRKEIILTISGADPESHLGRTLRTMGIGDGDDEVLMLPTLNSALESCENELLKTFYVSQETARVPRSTPSVAVPGCENHLNPLTSMPDNSPRTMERAAAARTTMEEYETVRRANKWQNLSEPLRLMLQIFQEASGKNEDFWFRVTDYFERRHYSQGVVLFRAGESAEGFWLLEKGVLRAEYNLPQGFLCESIVAGTTCGELPFFGESPRTATVTAERESIAWMLTREKWNEMQSKEPDVARELLRVGLKLTSERMEIITNYTLAQAG